MCAIKAAAAIDPRFQRLFLETNFPWGAAPGLDEQAPLALNTYGVVDPVRTSNPSVNRGQRPRLQSLPGHDLPATRPDAFPTSDKAPAAAQLTSGPIS